MPGPTTQRKRRQKAKNPEQERQSIAELQRLCADEDLTRLDSRAFDDLPLSGYTREGLKEANYTAMTDIQAKSIPLLLHGKDVLGAAKTGSGKTLAFLVPLLECLYRSQWTQMDGLGALVISPTRELALQIFQVLTRIGKRHSFSAGLLIGGKDVDAEKKRVARMNILVATPGRLLQHMDETPEFTADNLQLLVLDEAGMPFRYFNAPADRILDNGFEKTLNAIVENLPRQRQTMLFSATQTKSVRDLARLSLKDPSYVSVHEKSASSTPAKLKQSYIQLDLPQKLEVVYSFLKTHQKSKIIVFLSSCKQVRLIYESFCKMQPGIPLMCLHGKQKQIKRTGIFEQFCRKQVVCLFATDIAARGLDFPAVDWVIQVDCPESTDTYIHRVGRTARYDLSGNALLLLLPSERAFLERLEERKIPITETRVNPKKIEENGANRVARNLAAYCSQDAELKYLAQKSFVSYVRSVFLQKDKSVFKVEELPLEAFAQSLGLAGMPKIKFVKKLEKVQNRKIVEEDEESTKAPKSRVERLFKKKNQNVFSEHFQKLSDVSGGPLLADEDSKLIASDEDDDEPTEFVLKRADHSISGIPTGSIGTPAADPPSKRQLVKAKEKEIKNRGSGKKFHFDESGTPILTYALQDLQDYTDNLGGQGGIVGAATEHGLELRSGLEKADVQDKVREKERRREEKRERKRKMREREGLLPLGGGESLDQPLDEADASVDMEDNAPHVELEVDMNEDSAEEPPKKKRN